MNRRRRMCSACPFNPARREHDIPADVLDVVHERIALGEQWICHLTCVGPQPTPRSLLCAGAP